MNTRKDATLNKYKKYKNKLTSILRQAEKDYFSRKILEAKDNIAKTWSILNRITRKNNGTKSVVNKIVTGNTVISDPAVIAGKFNEFFVNVGSDLVKKIPIGTKSPTDFLTGSYCNSMFFLPTTAQEVSDTINNLKNSNSTCIVNLRRTDRGIFIPQACLKAHNWVG